MDTGPVTVSSPDLPYGGIWAMVLFCGPSWFLPVLGIWFSKLPRNSVSTPCPSTNRFRFCLLVSDAYSQKPDQQLPFVAVVAIALTERVKPVPFAMRHHCRAGP